MNDNEHLLDDKKHIVSIRLNNSDRIAVRAMAARLFVRESELYRFAVYHLLNRLHKLHEDTCVGSDLLPLFIEFKDELNTHLGLKKHQLFKIFNGKNPDPEKFVSMADIELLLLPQHAVRQRLQQMNEAAGQRRADTNAWLLEYLKEKYRFSVYDPDAELPLLDSLALENR
ncbi:MULTISPECIES: hypothetical protein [Methylomonas]|uniref:Uncharacterized protein n=2 Tax=Methylomonas TaxID=416 RepID=A0A177M1H0_METMH|nr:MULTISPECIES: hypothetical protein [Methylomonas]MCQ8117636.1 hypothetical protein [Methylomonas sp. WSC-7]OAH97696.1 hypothetical protein A1332_04675 [Methylomonas methanica]OAH99556.1 hypothetical protein A1353_20880 [Methylomonas methanica]